MSPCDGSVSLKYHIMLTLTRAFVLMDEPNPNPDAGPVCRYPLQIVDRGCYLYYHLELSFYLSLLITITIDIQRKDFTEMFIHHLATIGLLVLSYVLLHTTPDHEYARVH